LFPVRLLLAIILPPVAVMLCGKWSDVPLNVLLTLCAWFPGVVHAVLIVIAPSGRHRPTYPRRRPPGGPILPAT
jgi:uncharacterized membrane protein YqaE (UPF0057 family)